MIGWGLIMLEKVWHWFTTIETGHMAVDKGPMMINTNQYYLSADVSWLDYGLYWLK